jgi:DinB superfamily
MNRLSLLTDSILFARGYTVELIDTIPQDEWFTIPAECPTHVAWQVGHLATAEARLVLERASRRNAEAEGLPAGYLPLFLRTMVVEPDPAKYPQAQEIRAVFDRIHQAALRALKDLDDNDLDTVVEGAQHRFCRTKFDFVRWCSHHEFLHTGQIGLIRRMLGHKPVW